MIIDKRPEKLVDHCSRCGSQIYYLVYKYAGHVKYMPVNPLSMKLMQKAAVLFFDYILKFDPVSGHVSHFITCPVKPINRYNKKCFYLKKKKIKEI